MTEQIRQKGADKTARNPIKIIPDSNKAALRKPPWIRVRSSSSKEFYDVKIQHIHIEDKIEFKINFYLFIIFNITKDN